MSRPTHDTPTKFSRSIKGKTYWYWRFRGQTGSLGPASDPSRVDAAWVTVLHRAADSPTGAVFAADAVLLVELLAQYRASADFPASPDAAERLERAAILLTAQNQTLYPGGPDYTELEASELTAPAFKAWRRWLVSLRSGDEKRYSGTVISRLSRSVVAAYTWGVSEGIVKPDVVAALREVCRVPLVGAKSGAKRSPANPAHLEAVIPHLPVSLQAVVQLQRITASRPAELLALTPGSVLRAGVADVPGFGRIDLGELWVLPLTDHKNTGKGKYRAIWFFAEAQAILAPWLEGDPEAPVFSPRAEQAARFELRRASRKSKVQPSQVNRRVAKPKRAPGQVWTSHAYNNALKRACRKAGVPILTPYQIRHLGKNELTRRYGVEVARVMMGHEKTSTTDLYGGKDFELVKQAAGG
jgi:integrase